MIKIVISKTILRFCKDTNKPTCTIKGNDGYYWVTTIGYAQILLNNGFELLK